MHQDDAERTGLEVTAGSLTAGLLLNEGSALFMAGNGLRLLVTRLPEKGPPVPVANARLAGLREE